MGRRNARSEDLEDGKKSEFIACYLLTSLCPRYKEDTYIGYTVNPQRRLMQHNGMLRRGARKIMVKRPWEMVLCIYGFPSNVSANQFEMAWQNPRKLLGIKQWAVHYKYQDGLAAKIKLAYKLLTLPAWNELILAVNFFSTKYTKYYAGCPSLPSHMRVHVRSMDELSCYTNGYTEVAYDIGNCSWEVEYDIRNCSWDDDEEPDHRDVGSEATFTAMGRRNARSEDLKDGKKSEFIACYLLTSLCPRYRGHTYIGFTENPRRRIMEHNGMLCGGECRTKVKRPWEMVLCIYGFPSNDSAREFEKAWQHPRKVWGIKQWAVHYKYRDGLIPKIELAYKLLTLPAWNELILTVNFFSTKYTKYYAAGCPSLPSHMRVHVRSMDELSCYTKGYTEVEYDIGHRDVGSEATFTEEATCVLDIEDHEQPSCSNDSPGWLFSRTLERSPATMEDENAKMDDGMGSCSRVAIDLLTPSRELRTKSRISASSVEEVEVMDLLTPSPELRTKSPRTKKSIPFICPEIVDLTHSY